MSEFVKELHVISEEKNTQVRKSRLDNLNPDTTEKSKRRKASS